MNRYKFDLLLKEFSFLEGILRVTKRMDSVCKHEKDFSVVVREQEEKYYAENFLFCWKEEGDYIYPSYVEVPESILVKRGDDNLLNQTPVFDGYSSSGYYREERSDYCAVSGENVAWLEADGSFKHGDGSSNEEVADNVGEQLFSKKLSPDFIVRVDREELGYDKTINVVIYKMNKFDLVGYHCEQVDKAAKQLKDDIRIACDKGGQI